MIKLFFSLILMLTLSACSYLMEHRPISYERIPLRDSGPINYCKAHQSERRLLSTNEKAPQVFEETLKRIKIKKVLSPVEEAVLWALFQFNIRPESSTPKAHLQLMIYTQKEAKYWSFAQTNPESTDNFSYLYGLQTLLSYYGSKSFLVDLASDLEQALPKQIPIGKEFSIFIQNNNSKFKKDPIFERSFFKAEIPLSQDETLPRLPFKRIVTETSQALSRHHQYVTLDHLFQDEKNPRMSCNFDINIYNNDIFLIEQEALELNNSFAYAYKNEFMMMAVSSQKIAMKSMNNTFLFEGNTEVRPAAFCQYAHKEKNIIMLSDHGRDPGQILYYYLQDSITQSKTLPQLNEYMRSGRRLRLYNPDRILFESQRASQKLVDQLNSQDLPLYHAASLGHVWIWARINSDVEGFLSDSRREGHHLCPHTF